MQQKCYRWRLFLWQITEKLFNWFTQLREFTGSYHWKVYRVFHGLVQAWFGPGSDSVSLQFLSVLSAFKCWLCSWAGLIKWQPAALMVILHSHPRSEWRPRSVFRTITPKSQTSLWLDYPDSNLWAREMPCTDWLKVLSITMAGNGIFLRGLDQKGPPLDLKIRFISAKLHGCHSRKMKWILEEQNQCFLQLKNNF